MRTNYLITFLYTHSMRGIFNVSFLSKSKPAMNWYYRVLCGTYLSESQQRLLSLGTKVGTYPTFPTSKFT